MKITDVDYSKFTPLELVEMYNKFSSEIAEMCYAQGLIHSEFVKTGFSLVKAKPLCFLVDFILEVITYE